MCDSKSNNNQEWKKSGISLKYPSYRNRIIVSNSSWIRGKQRDDQAEGLWRINDQLYDLTPFLAKHPGGRFWLETTKGTDITEQFESHHIRGVPEALLSKFFVRNAAEPRNYTLTLEENGFYKTLKRRVAEQLKDLDYGPQKRTHFYHLGLLTSTLVLFVIATLNISFIIELMAALSLAWLAVTAHNFFHKRDNWQMYTFNLCLMNFTDWRISHVLSHHHYPNSMHDLELSLMEPFLCWVPNKYILSKRSRFFSVLQQPVFYLVMILGTFVQRILALVMRKNKFYWHDIIGFVLPLLMMAFSSAPPMEVVVQWLRIICLSSFIFDFIGINAAHHTPDIYHDGDAMRKDRDWGLYQLDAIIDRKDIKGSQFMVLTHFGNHALHHLFPTLDHGILPQLYPTLMKTVEEFKGDLREISFLDHLIGQQKQLLRTKANPIAPCERKSKNS